MAVIPGSTARRDWRPNQYGYELWGCRVGIEFPVVKLMDYRERGGELEASDNPFAIVVMAHLQTQARPADLERSGPIIGR